jgi:YD repeat-containing protein
MTQRSQPTIRFPLMLAALALCVLACSSANAQQGGVTRYVYDNNGRLRAVIAPNGEAAIYDYDPAGNFTAIRRLTANDFEVIEFTPREGAIATPVTIFGVGFGGAVSSVSFNGAAAQIISQTPTSVVAHVPAGATTGPISVTSPRGTRMTADPFTVKGVGVTPGAAVVASGRRIQFTANVAGLIDPTVTWSVNSVAGGNSAVGTIKAMGLYTAPNVPNPPDGLFTIRATSVFEPMLFGEAQVTVPSQGGGYDVIYAGVSVRYGTPMPPSNVPTVPTHAVSVRYGVQMPPTQVPSFVVNGVSVRYGALTPPTEVPSFVTNGVSVRYGVPTPPTAVPSQVNAPVSVTQGAVVTTVSPASIARGATATVTISGANLSGASLVRFANEDGTLESNISASNINVNANGTSLTATVNVNTNTPTGNRIVLVTAVAGVSLRVNTGTNMLQIAP